MQASLGANRMAPGQHRYANRLPAGLALQQHGLAGREEPRCRDAHPIRADISPGLSMPLTPLSSATRSLLFVLFTTVYVRSCAQAMRRRHAQVAAEGRRAGGRAPLRTRGQWGVLWLAAQHFLL